MTTAKVAVTMQSEPEPAESEQISDRVARVRVWGLLDMFDHEIPLNLDSRITVIHGSNGVGKTIVLRMIYELLSGEPNVLLRVPYHKFELEFASGDKITVQRDTSQKKCRCHRSFEVRGCAQYQTT